MPRSTKVIMYPGETLWNICQQIHEEYTGSTDLLSNNLRRRDRFRKILEHAIQYWTPSPKLEDKPLIKEFDEAVFKLLTVTLNELTLVSSDYDKREKPT